MLVTLLRMLIEADAAGKPRDHQASFIWIGDQEFSGLVRNRLTVADFTINGDADVEGGVKYTDSIKTCNSVTSRAVILRKATTHINTGSSVQCYAGNFAEWKHVIWIFKSITNVKVIVPRAVFIL